MSEISSVQPSGPTPDFSSLPEPPDVRDCFQCQKCSAGCPVAFAMDYKPNQVIQMVSLGMKDRLLACKTIWVCASCYTCSESGNHYELPIFYFTELIGLAMGHRDAHKWLRCHFVDPRKLLASKGLV